MYSVCTYAHVQCITVLHDLLQTLESVICVLRNLSYQLETEVDLQDGAEDVLDPQWEAEQRMETEEASGRFIRVHVTI